MRLGSGHRFVWSMGVAAACLVAVVSVRVSARQAAPAQGPLMTEQVFKNIKVLNGMPVDTFFDIMGMFAASMGDDCTFCHVKAAVFDHEEFGTATPLINRARAMIGMTRTINKTFFAGEPRITCFTCHRGNNKPTAPPDFAVQYGPPVDDPSLMDFPVDDRIPAAQVLDKYLEALGGTAALAKLTSFTAKGTYSGFDTGHKEVPVDIYAKAPNQRTWIVHMPDGDSYRVFDGKNAWWGGPDSPAPLMTLTSGNLDRYRLEAMVAFPASIKTAFSSWKVGRTAIDDNPVTIVQGSNPGGLLPVNFYFDNESGLLVRMLRWNLTPLGPVPTQIDYSDYEDVAGVKMPKTWTASQTFMQMTIKLEDVEPNVAIPASRFVQPPPGKKPMP